MKTQPLIQINLRVPDELAADLDRLAKHHRVSRISVARQILEDGIAARKREMALRAYTDGKVSKSRAAEMAGISLWEMYDIVQREGVRQPMTLDDALAEVRRLVAPATL